MTFEYIGGPYVPGKFHLKKTKEYITAIRIWIKDNPTASSGDRAAAENVLRDLNNALK